MTIDTSGVLTMITTTHEITRLTGCSCMVTVLLADDQRVLWETSPKTYTVTSKVESLITGARSDRTDTWAEKVPVDRLARVRHIAIVHAAAPWGNHGQGGEVNQITRLLSLIPGVGALAESKNGVTGFSTSDGDGAVAPYHFDMTALVGVPGSCINPFDADPTTPIFNAMLKALGVCK